MRLGFTCTLRFYTPSLFDTFVTFNTFEWCIMSSYKSIAMIKVTKLSNQNHMPCKHLPKTGLIHRQVMRPLRHGGSHFVNAFWHGNQDGSDVTSCYAVTTRWHCRKQTALIADSTGIIWNIWNKPIIDSRAWCSTMSLFDKSNIPILLDGCVVCGTPKFYNFIYLVDQPQCLDTRCTVTNALHAVCR